VGVPALCVLIWREWETLVFFQKNLILTTGFHRAGPYRLEEPFCPVAGLAWADGLQPRGRSHAAALPVIHRMPRQGGGGSRALKPPLGRVAWRIGQPFFRAFHTSFKPWLAEGNMLGWFPQLVPLP